MKKLHKVKLAVFFGYSGKGYHGMQKVVGIPTIEGVLEEAFYKAGMISENNYGNLKKLGWSRGSRTDKGVHASFNSIALKLMLSSKFIDSIEDILTGEKKGKILFILILIIKKLIKLSLRI